MIKLKRYMTSQSSYTCLLFYDYLREKIPSFSLTLSSEQHYYNTHSTPFDQLVIESLQTNHISCQVLGANIFGTSILNPRKKALECALKHHYTAQHYSTWLSFLILHIINNNYCNYFL